MFFGFHNERLCNKNFTCSNSKIGLRWNDHCAGLIAEVLIWIILRLCQLMVGGLSMYSSNLPKSTFTYDYYIQTPQKFDISSFENKDWHLLHIDSKFGPGKICLKIDVYNNDRDMKDQLSNIHSELLSIS